MKLTKRQRKVLEILKERRKLREDVHARFNEAVADMKMSEWNELAESMMVEIYNPNKILVQITDTGIDKLEETL